MTLFCSAQPHDPIGGPASGTLITQTATLAPATTVLWAFERKKGARTLSI